MVADSDQRNVCRNTSYTLGDKIMRISNGNNKIGRIANISMTPIASCNGCADICGRDCYAMKAYRQYPATREAWDQNLKQATNDMGSFFDEIQAYLAKYKKTFFRWHVSGDIINRDYFANMVSMVMLFPHIKFLAFTKQYAIINQHLDLYNILPENISIVFSAWPKHPLDNPHGMPVAWMQDGTEDRIPDDALHCIGNCETCGLCWNLKSIGRDVYFDKH